jgi:predicted transcriptional regulator
VDAAALRKRITDKLVGDVSETMYPSATMLNRVEAALATPDDVAEYAETLVKKVEETRFPSTEMLNRLDGLVTRLETLERQQQQRRQLQAAQERS